MESYGDHLDLHLLRHSCPTRRSSYLGDGAGGILRNRSLSGALKVTSAFLTGNDLKLASDKLNGRIDLLLDLKTGRYQVNLNGGLRSEEHTSELQSLMRISYAVFCLKKKNKQHSDKY